MQRLNRNKAIALLDENERGMISKLSERCNCLEPLETRTCKAGDFTLIAKQSDIGNTKEIHLMSFYEDDKKYEYVADAYVSSTMDKSNYYQFLFNSVSNYKKDQEMTEDALNVYKENARNLFPGEELSYAFGGQLTISVLNKGDINRVGQNKYVISLTVSFLKTDQEEIYEKDLFTTIDKFYNAHKEDVALATKAQHIMKQCLNLSERGAAQFIYEHEYFVVTRTVEEACKFDLSYGNTDEGFVRAKQKCLQDKDFENSVIGLTPLLLSKNIYEYLQKCEMTKFLSDEVMKVMTEAPLGDAAKDAKPEDAKAEPKKENGDSKEEPKKDADASKEEPKKDAAATEQKK
ncbi:MAG: hypothetical protein K6F31_00085 [Acetatifactor sp.]|nr:hypothetical protein [Acetatifactor sp.]